MSEKLCVFCDHFGWNRFEYYRYSTYTDGTNGGVTCAKGKLAPIYFSPHGGWARNRPDVELMPDDTDDFRRMIRSAEKCNSYSPPK